MSIRSTLAKLIAPAEPLGAGLLTPSGETQTRAWNTSSHWFLTGRDGPDDAGTGRRSLGQPLARSAWVLRAIKHVAEPIAAAPLRFSETGRRGEKQINDAELARFWESPALGPEGVLSRVEAIEATVCWLKLSGEAFWVLDDTWLLPRGARNPFIIAPPSSMIEILSADGRALLGWRYRNAAGRETLLLPEQVIHPKLFNPYNPVRGLPEYLAAKLAAEADAAAGEFVRNLLAENDDRGQIITLNKGATITPAQLQQAERALLEKRRASRRGEFKTVFLSVDGNIHEPHVATTNAEFVAQRIENRKEIFAAFGVPASMAEPKASYSIGSASDELHLIFNTCQPFSEKLAEHVEAVSRRYKLRAAPLFAWFDFSQHPAVRALNVERIETGSKLWDRGVPWDAINEFLGLGLPKFPGSEKAYVPFSMQPLDANGNEPTGENPPAGKLADRARTATVEVISTGDVAANLLDVLRHAPGAEVRAMLPALTAATPRASGESEEERARLWRQHFRARRPAENATLASVNRVLMSARSTVLRKLGANERTAKDGATRDDKPKGTPGDFLFDPITFRVALQSALDKAARVNMQRAGEEARTEIGLDDAWTMAPEDVLTALANRAPLIGSAGDDIFAAVRDTLADGIKAGETTAELAQRVRQAFKTVSSANAKTIAITETGFAYEAGRHSAQKAAGVKRKQWLSARDSRVRTTHRDADRQTVGIDDNFHVGADSTPYPCGPGLTAKEACNCRCVSIAVKD